MKSLVIILAVLFLSCTPDRVSTNYSEPISAESVDSVYVEPKPSKYYSFISLVIEQPYSGKHRFTTEIDTVEVEVTEDFKFQQLDIAERNLRDAEFDTLSNIKVLNRDYFVHSSYKEVSLKRQEILNK